MKTIILPLLLSLVAAAARAQEITPPEKFFGHKPGADRKLFTYTKAIEYCARVARASDVVEMIDLGKSTNGHPFVMMVVSSPKNLRNIERWKRISRRLESGRLMEEEARRLAREGKVIVLVTLNIHSTEIASSQLAPELLYELATGDVPFDRAKVLDNVIFLLMPSINPDGQLMVTDWYRKNVGTEHEGGRMPWLYHHYAGHDNNRDWFMFNLIETAYVSDVYYNSWIPQVILDEHQMWQTGARFFVPPYTEPPNPNVHPLVWRQLAGFGSHMSLRLEQDEKPGVVDGQTFTGWWPGASIMTPWWHNRIGLLTEAASVHIASPIRIDPSELRNNKLSMRNPNPWKGGMWRMRDIMDYERIATYAVLEYAAERREDILYNFHRMGADQIKWGRTKAPYAYLIPQEQHDVSAREKLLEILAFTGVEIRELAEPVSVDRRRFAAGTIAISMAQPKRAYVKNLFEIQHYPDTTQLYDVPGWTLPLQFGVRVFEVDEPVALNLRRRSTRAGAAPAEFRRRSAEVRIDARSNDAAIAVNRLLKARVEVRRGPDGTFLVELNAASRRALPDAMEELHLSVGQAADRTEGEGFRLKPVRVGLYKPWTGSMDEGWTRLILENFEFTSRSIDNARMKDGDLQDDFDAIILPDVGRERILDGLKEGVPKAYQGGIGKEGTKALVAFVKQGGTLICFDDSTEWAIEALSLPASNALEGNKEFSCPGSVLRTTVDTSHPLGFGMKKETSVYFVSGRAFTTRVPRGKMDRAIVSRFPERDILMSGLIKGEKAIAGRAALVECRVDKGRVVLFGFRPQFRAQTLGTFKFLFNAIFLATAERVELGEN